VVKVQPKPFSCWLLGKGNLYPNDKFPKNTLKVSPKYVLNNGFVALHPSFFEVKQKTCKVVTRWASTSNTVELFHPVKWPEKKLVYPGLEPPISGVKKPFTTLLIKIVGAPKDPILLEHWNTWGASCTLLGGIATQIFLIFHPEPWGNNQF